MGEMRASRLTRGQKLVLVLMGLALIAVLVVLIALFRQNSAARPLATPIPTTWKLPPTITAPPPTMTPTGGPASGETPTPTEPSLAAEVLAVRRIEALVRNVGQVRELPKRLEIPFNFVSEREMASYLRRMLFDADRRAFVERQQLLLAALDLLPEPGEAFPTPVQVRVDHLIAFYDPADAQIFISPLGRDADPPDGSLVHQYAHALIGQHFDLEALSADAPNADAARARDALMEGDATVVWALQSTGRVDGFDLDAAAAHLSKVELTDYEGYLTSRAMGDVFLFPYREGTEFVAALLQAGWWPAVNAAYLDPPASTEQILHPDKYIATPRDAPRTVDLPDLSEDLEGSWQLAAQDVIGERVLRAHLDQYLPDSEEAARAAAGWDGDLAALWKDLDGREVLVLRILWDDHDEAIEFVNSYTTLIDRRLRGVRRVVRSIVPPTGRWYRGPGGNAYIQRKRDEVLVIWAPDTDTLERVLSVFVLGAE